uniref:Putative disease resistance protein n=1 Tax=Noccaea caerulescens TaxID=107243 RepID=A0A1J3K0V3_NOCCA
MGNCIAINFDFNDQTLSRIFGFLGGKGYIRNLRDNLRYLRREIENLKLTQQEVKEKVARDKAQPRKRLWLNRVEETDREFNDLRRTSDDHLKELFLCDLCSINVCSSYYYGERVFLLLEDIKRLNQEGEDLISEDQRQQPQQVQRQQPQAGQIQQPQAGQRQPPVVTSQGCMFNVGNLKISGEDKATYWTFMSITESANESAFEVAKMRECYYLDVRGKFNTEKLTSGTRYEVVFVVKVEDTMSTWKFPAKVHLMVPGNPLQERELHFDDLQRNEWVEIQAGVFVAPPLKKEVEFRLYQKRPHEMTGLVVKGAIVRPME